MDKIEAEDRLIVTKEEEGLRIDKFLTERFKDIHSRTYFQKLLENSKVKINGAFAKKRILVEEGDEVEVFFILDPSLQDSLKAENIPLEILYEDEDLVVINKQRGIVVHPSLGHFSGTLVNALLYHFDTLSEKNSHRPGIVHRLDKDTSGALVIAKNDLCHQRLVELFAGREVYKEYVAVVAGVPKSQELTTLIGRSASDRKKMAVVETGGKTAVTGIEPLGHNKMFCWVKLILKTGRTHQIRVHLQHVGCPILGDAVYGPVALNKKHGEENPLLHAHVLSFIHPMTKKEIKVTAPLPHDMMEWYKKLV